MKASPQARLNRRILILSVAVAGAAAFAYRAARPSKLEASRGSLSAAPADSGHERGEAPTARSGTQPPSPRLPALEIPARSSLPSEVLQPYPSQPAVPAQDAELPEHPVNRYSLDATQRFLELQVLAPELGDDGWHIELSAHGGLIWQHAGDVADSAGIVRLELPAQRLKAGRYVLSMRRQLAPDGRAYLYQFDVDLEEAD